MKKDDATNTSLDAVKECDPSADPLCNSKLPSTKQNAAALQSFENEQSYRDYILGLAKKIVDGGGKSYGESPAMAGTINTGITNTQESGVDEGGIVKNIGEYLVILRKGRLYAVNVKDPGTPKQSDAIFVPSTKSLYENVWYDEMLVSGNQVMVLGFRYVVPGGLSPGAVSPGAIATEPNQLTSGATELHTYTLDNGKFVRGKSLFIESTDYFSSSNFSSRLVGNSLFFYLPEQAIKYSSGTPEPTIPRFLNFTDSASGGTFSFGERILSATDIFRPIDQPSTPTIHMIVNCSLSVPTEPKCKARAVLGDSSQHYYASKDHAFLWSYPWAYALPLDSLTPKVFNVKGYGEPLSFLGFKQDEGSLHVIVRDIRNAKGSIFDAQGPLDGEQILDSSTEVTSTGEATQPVTNSDQQSAPYENILSSLKLPLSGFNGVGGQTIGEENVSRIYSTNGIIQTGIPRFVGNTALIPLTIFDADSTGAGSSSKGEGQNFVATFDIKTKATRVGEWTGNISRIESVGSETAVIVDSGDLTTGRPTAISATKGLRLSTIKIGSDLPPLSQVVLPGASEGESRTHAFFYKEGANATGTFALAVINSNNNQTKWFGSGISNLAFIMKDANHKLTLAGTASSQGSFQATCVSSCMDWYGNTRPIFLGSKIYALLGNEIGEVKIAAGKVSRSGSALIMK